MSRGANLRWPLLALPLALAACGGGNGNGGGSSGAGGMLQLAPANASIAYPQSGCAPQFTAQLVSSDGSMRDVTTSAQWSSSDPSVATVQVNTGCAQPLRHGTTTVTAQLAGGAAGSTPLTVTAAIASVSVTPAGASIGTDDTQQYAAAAVLTDSTSRDVTASAQWNSSDTSIATVDNGSSKGLATGVSPGSADIIAGYPGVQGRTAITVTARTLYGGGDTLPALAYVGSAWFDSTSPEDSRRLVYPPDDDSVFGQYMARTLGKPQVSYCQSGSRKGMDVFVGAVGASAQGSCGSFASAANGFSAPGAEPDFAASELPMTKSDRDVFSSAKAARDEPVQVPAIAAAIGIFYNNADVSGTLALSELQLCRIMSGQIASWKDLGYADKPIRLVYRADPSGATFALSNHLSAVCAGAGYLPVPASATFRTDAVYAGVISPLPAAAIPVAGSAGAAGAISGTDGAIGYSEAADMRLRAPALRHATLRGADPFADLSAPSVVTATDMVIGSSDAAGRPTTIAVPPPGTRGCLVLATPDSYADPAGYPIVTVSYLLAYSGANGSKASKLQQLLSAPYSGAIQRNTATAGPGSGFVFLDDKFGPTLDKCVRR
jgi:ABC-type phosphate transport system substrate-binding protein